MRPALMLAALPVALIVLLFAAGLARVITQ